LFPDLRAALIDATSTARSDNRGVWAEDRTNAWFEVTNLESITEEHVILPKLFRRLAEYLRGGGSALGFKEFLELKQERITLISTTHFTHFDTIIEVNGMEVRMTEAPENIVFEG
jgi:hypothetical protein